MQNYCLSIKRSETLVLFSDPVSKLIFGLYLAPTDVLVAFRYYL